MKYLLTSAGITNPNIHTALVKLLAKPIDQCHALCIPTASYAISNGSDSAWRFISGNEPRTPMGELGWESLGGLELTALPSIDRPRWVPVVQQCYVLLDGGGDPLYLGAGMQQSWLAELLPSLSNLVYVGSVS